MKRIGFDKAVRLAWLDEIAFSFLDKGKAAEVYDHLKDYLAEEIKGAESRRKYITVLKRIWLTVPAEHRELRDRALSQLKKVSAAERLAIHWGMSLLAYPFFRDVAGTIGNLLNLQEEISASQVKRRIVAGWGERRTLDYAVPRVIQSLEDWGVLERLGKGNYRLNNKQALVSKEIVLWLLECYMEVMEEDTLSLAYLQKVPAFFPFTYKVNPGDLHASGKFEVSREGLDRDVVELRMS